MGAGVGSSGAVWKEAGDEEREEVLVVAAESSESQFTGAKIASTKRIRSSGSSSGTAVKTEEGNCGRGGRGGGMSDGGGVEARM